MANACRLLVVATLLLSSCSRTERGKQGSSMGPAGECTGIGAPLPAGSGPPEGLAILVAGPRPPIRDATVTAPGKDGVAVFARPMLSRITSADGARVAIRFKVDAARGRGASWRLSSTRVRVVRPDGATRALELAPLGREIPIMTDPGRTTELTIDGHGLRLWGEMQRWSTADEALLAAPGRYKLRIEGSIDGGDAPLAFGTPDIPFEVVPAGPAWKPLSALDAAASAAVAARSCTAVPPSAVRGAIDDVADGRWIRFWLGEGYHADIVDVLVSPAGALVAMQEFHHFTCVARGTPIAVPGGAVPVEALAPDAVIWGYDVETGRRVEARVVAVSESAREALIDLGSVRLTPEHPVFAGGRWTPAGEVGAGAPLVAFEGPAPLARPARVVGREAVFDVTVTWPSTFFAGGVLVHNKAVGNELAPHDPWRGTFLRATDAAPEAPEKKRP